MDYTTEDFKNLNEIEKEEYTRHILEMDASVTDYVKNVFLKLENIEDNVVFAEQ